MEEEEEEKEEDNVKGITDRFYIALAKLDSRSKDIRTTNTVEFSNSNSPERTMTLSL